jgi:hypothetical protein
MSLSRRWTRRNFAAGRSCADRRRTSWCLRRCSWRRDHSLQPRPMSCLAGMTRAERRQSSEAMSRGLLLSRRVSCFRGPAGGFVQRGRARIHCDAWEIGSNAVHVTMAWVCVSAHCEVPSNGNGNGHGSRVVSADGLWGVWAVSRAAAINSGTGRRIARQSRDTVGGRSGGVGAG